MPPPDTVDTKETRPATQLASDKVAAAQKKLERGLAELTDTLAAKGTTVTRHPGPGQMLQYEIRATTKDGPASLWFRLSKPKASSDTSASVGDVGIRVSLIRMELINDGISLRDDAKNLPKSYKAKLPDVGLDELMNLAADVTAGRRKMLGSHAVAESLTDALRRLKLPANIPPGSLQVDSFPYTGPEFYGNPQAGRLKNVLDAYDKWIVENPGATTREKSEFAHGAIYKEYGNYSPELSSLLGKKDALEAEIEFISRNGTKLPGGLFSEKEIIELREHLSLALRDKTAVTSVEAEMFDFTDGQLLPSVEKLTNLTPVQQRAELDKYKLLDKKLSDAESAGKPALYAAAEKEFEGHWDRLSKMLVDLRVAESEAVIGKTLFRGKTSPLDTGELRDFHRMVFEARTPSELKLDLDVVERQILHADSTNNIDKLEGTDQSPVDVNAGFRKNTLVCKDYSALFSMFYQHACIRSRFITDTPGNHAFVFLPDERVIIESTATTFDSAWRPIPAGEEPNKPSLKADTIPASVMDGNMRYTFSLSDASRKLTVPPDIHAIEIRSERYISVELKKKALTDSEAALKRIMDEDASALRDLVLPK